MFCIGGDVFQTFLASGLPNFVLSHIWNLCDIGQTGKLNAEQFALASYFISLKLQGLISIENTIRVKGVARNLLGGDNRQQRKSLGFTNRFLALYFLQTFLV